MKSLKERLEEKIKKDATLRSMKQCSTGQDDLNKAISWYLKVGFEDGAASLLPLVLELENKLKEIRWSWENDAGRNCDNLAHEALESIEKFLEGKND